MDHSTSSAKYNQVPPEKLLPRAQEAERILLGCILRRYDDHGQLIDKLTTQYFPVETDKRILSAMIRLREAGKAIDPITVHEEMKRVGHFDGTLSYLYGLTEGIPDRPNVDAYLAIVREKADLRLLIEQSHNVEGLAATGFSPAEIIASNQRVVDTIQKRTLGKPMMRVMTIDALLDSDIELPSMAVEGLIEKNALNMAYGAQRGGKSLLMAQLAMAIADRQKSLFGWFKINIEGPTMFIQADDKSKGASLKDIALRSAVSMRGKPFFPVPEVEGTLGDEFYDELESEIKSKGLVFVVLDSWTALRAKRQGGDIVKDEQQELGALCDLALRTNCTIGLIHHESQNSKRSSFHWADRAGGTFAVGATPAVHIQVSRFSELEDNARERLVRTRGRHMDGETFALRFQKQTSDYELIMTGNAAEFYPLLEKLKSEFGRNVFKPKDLTSLTGVSRATGTRQIEILCHAGAITRLRFGEYMVVERGS